MIIGASIFALHPDHPIAFVFFPLVVRAIGLFASLVGVMMVSLRNEQEDPNKALNRGYYVSSILAALGFGVITYLDAPSDPGNCSSPAAWSALC